MAEGVSRKRVFEHGGRYFAAGIRADPTAHYFVEPEAQELYRDVSRGKYCILTGHRQAGKTTSVVYCMNRLAADTSLVPIIFSRGISGADKSWSSHTMWQRLCQLLHLSCKERFPAVQAGHVYSSDDFVEAFRADTLLVRVVLVIDEADTLLKLNEACVGEFLHNIRGLKSDYGVYNLHTMVLVGTDRVKDLARQPSTPSPYSPFQHDHALSPVRFTLMDIEELLKQFAADYPHANVEVHDIATSIFELTAGHKGLAGTCLAFMDQEGAYTLSQWETLVMNNSLVTHVFRLATYSRVMQAIREDGGRHLKAFVEHLHVRYSLNDSLLELRDYIYSGVLLVEDAAPHSYVKLSSPLLRMALLGRLKARNFHLERPPAEKLETEDDQVWVLTTVFELLDGNILRARASETGTWLNNDTPSEYSYQLAFISRLKAVLEQAYPLMKLRVLPEAREARVEGITGNLLRADSLVDNGPGFPRFSVEFLVSGTPGRLIRGYEKAVVYARRHSAVVYLVNITLDQDFNEVVPGSPSVVFVGLRFTTAENTARVKFVYSPQKHQPPLELALTLQNWEGELDY